ncbi:MAG: putative exported protein [Deltaproteobacteria bacterium]|nr:putative exported protein [Deltaproteobacteria bacterium]
MKLLVGDTLATGPEGSLGAIFRDNSSISMGPGSSFVVRQFEFAPESGKIGLLIRITRGSLAYLSGLIGKISPESARFETPTATIGIRGTRFAVQVGEDVPQ